MAISALVFVLLFGAGIVLAFVLKPIYGLYAYMLAFYVHPPSRWWGQLLPEVRWSLVAAGATLVALWLHGRKRQGARWYQTDVGLVLLLFVGWMWVEHLWVLNRSLNIEGLVLFTKYVVLFYLVFELSGDKYSIRNLMIGTLLGCLYLGWVAYTTPSHGRLEGVGGPGIDDANTLGVAFGVGLVSAGVLIFHRALWVKALAVLSAPFILNGIILTGSRGALLSLVSGSAVIFLLNPGRNRGLLYIYGTLGVLLLGTLANEQFLERMGTL